MSFILNYILLLNKGFFNTLTQHPLTHPSFLFFLVNPTDPPMYDPLFSFLFLILFFPLFFSSTNFFTNIHFLHILYLLFSTPLSSFFFYISLFSSTHTHLQRTHSLKFFIHPLTCQLKSIKN